MTTPPLDLPAHGALHPLLADAVARGGAAYGAGGDAEAVALAAAAPLLARAEAAEKAVAAVRELHAHKHYDKYGRSHKEPQGHGAWCTFCGNAPDDYCATIKALDGTL